MKKLLFSLLFIGIFAASCTREQVRPTGAIVNQERNFTNFSQIEVHSGIQLVLTQENYERVSIETYENVQGIIIAQKVNEKLIFKLPNDVYLSGDARIIVHIAAKNINSLLASGGSSITGSKPFKSTSLNIELSGGSSFSLPTDCGNIQANLSGGSIWRNMPAFSENANLLLSGGSRFDAYDFFCNRLICNVSGGSVVNISVNKDLNVRASGGSEVNYKGGATVSFSDLSGGSRLNKK